jgi:predicted dehydrogenase
MAMNRRNFLKNSAGASAVAAVGLGVLARSTASWAGANDKIRVACIGIKGRGQSHIGAFTGMEGVEVATLCDVDERLFAERVKSFFTDKQLKEPKLETDMRKVMDDPTIDAISIATPNHWHSLAAIWGCQAGKDVYVEKPCSHNISEGRKLVEAARKYDRIVQHGTQSRCSPGIREGIQKLHDGAIGDVYMGKAMCYKWRNTIGKTPDTDPPEGVHYDLWLGPAPKRPFSENRFHYNWHWHWDYGNGDIGNQGVHEMDMVRWGLGVQLPTKVSCMGGHFMFDDDQETPNTQLASFWYPDKGPKGVMLVFEVRHWITNYEGGVGEAPNNNVGTLYYGSEGYMAMKADGYQIYLGKNREPGESRYGTFSPFQNFVDAVRSRKREDLMAEVEEGHYSSALCHLANISYRLGRSVEFDPSTETFKGDADANALLTRNYRAPYSVPEVV